MNHPNGSTQMLALFGEDLRLSPSPATHTAWAQQAGLNWVYLPLPCRDEMTFINVCSALMRCSSFRGGNITNPFKRSALRLPGVQLDHSAELCGAANTLYRKDESDQSIWLLANTDLVGCSETLSRILSQLSTHPLANEPVNFIILGSGAMAETCAQAIALVCGHHHNINTITLSRAQLEHEDIRGLIPHTAHAHLVVINTLPSGTRPEADRLACRALDALNIGPASSKNIFEISYLKTKVSQQAELWGWRVTRGELLFVEQARASFKLWTRCSAPNPTTVLPQF